MALTDANGAYGKGASNAMISPDDLRKKPKWPSTVQTEAR